VQRRTNSPWIFCGKKLEMYQTAEITGILKNSILTTGLKMLGKHEKYEKESKRT
jgi:hypothetical protein